LTKPFGGLSPFSPPGPRTLVTLGAVRHETVALDDQRRQADVRSRLVLFPLGPVDGVAGRDRLRGADRAVDLASPFQDGEDLRTARRVARDASSCGEPEDGCLKR
jgi:hypothetical protein